MKVTVTFLDQGKVIDPPFRFEEPVFWPPQDQNEWGAYKAKVLRVMRLACYPAHAVFTFDGNGFSASIHATVIPGCVHLMGVQTAPYVESNHAIVETE